MELPPNEGTAEDDNNDDGGKEKSAESVPKPKMIIKPKVKSPLVKLEEEIKKLKNEKLSKIDFEVRMIKFESASEQEGALRWNKAAETIEVASEKLDTILKDIGKGGILKIHSNVH